MRCSRVFCLSVAMAAAGALLAAVFLPQAPAQFTPPGSVPWAQQAQGAATIITATQPAVPGKINYVTGFEVTGSGATAASVITVTLASGGTNIANWNVAIPAGVTAGVTPLIVEFTSPFSGLAAGQNMVMQVPSFGTGNTNASVVMRGFSQ